MQFIDNAPLYKVIRITGPHHNLLGLQLSEEPTTVDPEIEALDQDADHSVRLVGSEIAEQVMLGVEQASVEVGTTYYVEKILYVSSDSPPTSVYRYLAVEIVRRVYHLGSELRCNGSTRCGTRV